MELLLLALFAGGFGWLLLHGLNQKPREMAALRVRAEEQFRRTRIDEPTQEVHFDGSVATVIETRESTYLASLVASNYVLTVVATMPDGMKYVFRSATNGKPWVARQVQGNSRAVQASVPF